MSKKPRASNTKTTDIPIRWLANSTVTQPNNLGPINAVAFPEKANKPNISVRLSSGAKRPIKVLEAACTGPKNTPNISPQIQNQNISSTKRIAVTGIIKPMSEKSIVFLLPERSSIHEKPTAPRAAVTFSPIPKIIIWDSSIPKVPAA